MGKEAARTKELRKVKRQSVGCVQGKDASPIGSELKVQGRRDIVRDKAKGRSGGP